MDSGYSPGATGEVTGKEVNTDKVRKREGGGGVREEMKKKDCYWRSCSKSPGWKNYLVFPFICQYICSSWLSGSRHYIWNKTQRRRFYLSLLIASFSVSLPSSVWIAFVLKRRPPDLFSKIWYPWLMLLHKPKRQSRVCFAHAVFVKGLLQQHRCICHSMVRVTGIYNQGVCFYCLIW